LVFVGGVKKTWIFLLNCLSCHKSGSSAES
jgi:hypothetical protein